MVLSSTSRTLAKSYSQYEWIGPSSVVDRNWHGMLMNHGVKAHIVLNWTSLTGLRRVSHAKTVAC